jgi:uncharacterized protein YukE
MSDINVNFDTMQQNAVKLSSVHDDVVSKLGLVSAKMRDLESKGFSTPTASRQFQQLFSEWKTRATDLLKTMRDASDAMKSAMQMHDQADQAHAQAARSAIDTSRA